MTIGSNSAANAVVDCSSGKKALGGGGSATGYYGNLAISTPTDRGTGWIAGYENTSNYPVTVYAWVICANVTS